MNRLSDPDGLFEVRCADERVNPDSRDAKVVDRFHSQLNAYDHAERYSRTRDLAYGVWRTGSERFVADPRRSQ